MTWPNGLCISAVVATVTKPVVVHGERWHCWRVWWNERNPRKRYFQNLALFGGKERVDAPAWKKGTKYVFAEAPQTSCTSPTVPNLIQLFLAGMIPPSPPQTESPSDNTDDKNSESTASGVSNIRFHVTVEEDDDNDDDDDDDEDNDIDMWPTMSEVWSKNLGKKFTNFCKVLFRRNFKHIQFFFFKS